MYVRAHHLRLETGASPLGDGRRLAGNETDGGDAATATPFQQGWTLFVFILTITLVFCSVVGCVPYIRKVGFYWWPLFGAILLLIAGCAQGWDIIGTLVGDDKIQPYSILIIFNALAYQSLSLDATGALHFFSLLLLNQSNGSSLRFYLIIFFLASFVTLFTSNDIVILTLTPLVLYAAKEAKLDVEPFLVIQFYAANILSAAFIIGNPTNVIVGEAMGLSFGSFVAWMAVPAFVAALVALLWTLLIFRTPLKKTFKQTKMDAWAVLIDRRGAAVQSLILLLTLIAFPVVDAVGGRLWEVALAGGLLTLVSDLFRLKWVKQKPTWASLKSSLATMCFESTTSGPAEQSKNHQTTTNSGDGSRLVGVASQSGPEANQTAPTSIYSSSTSVSVGGINNNNSNGEVNGSNGEQQQRQPMRPDELSPKDVLSRDVETTTTDIVLEGSLVSMSLPSLHATPSEKKEEEDKEEKLHEMEMAIGGVEKKSVAELLLALPWSLIPFVYGMFFIVDAMVRAGWVEMLAHGLAGCLESAFGASVAMILVTVAFCNLVNNQPASILITRVLLSPDFTNNTNSDAVQAANFAVILGTNVGATTTPIGALAGVMFLKLIHGKTTLTGARFTMYGLICLIPLTIPGAFMIWIEAVTFPNNI